MLRKLDVDKAIQAVGVLLRREGKRATRLRIAKLLYIADRKSLKTTGSQILGSKLVAMKNGPLHSEILNLINGAHQDEPRWSQFFNNDGRDVVLQSEPSVGKLSRHEVSILNDVVDSRQHLNDWDVVDETHGFEEWVKNYPNRDENTSRPISLNDLIDGVGRSTDAESITQDLVDEDTYDRFFAGLSE
jgi:uncharacterized phage-associated protein